MQGLLADAGFTYKLFANQVQIPRNLQTDSKMNPVSNHLLIMSLFSYYRNRHNFSSETRETVAAVEKRIWIKPTSITDAK